MQEQVRQGAGKRAKLKGGDSKYKRRQKLETKYRNIFEKKEVGGHRAIEGKVE